MPTDNDWITIRRTSESLGPILCETLHELRAFMFVHDRTLRFRKFTEMVSLSQFRSGVNGVVPPSLGYPMWTWHTLNRAISSLSSKNVVKKRSRGSGMPPYYHLNVPGMLEVMISLFPNTNVYDSVLDRVRDEYVRCGLMFENGIVIREDVSMKLKDVIPSCEKKSMQTMSTRTQKRLLNGNPLWIRQFLLDYCDSEGIDSYKEDWSRKTHGQAKWWLARCVAREMEPRAHLRSVCDRWGDIRSFLIKKFNIKTKPYITFSEYIMFYKKIDEFLAFGDVDNSASTSVIFARANDVLTIED